MIELFVFFGCVIVLISKAIYEEVKIALNNKKYREYLARHNFNRERQFELECKTMCELEEMLGVDRDDYTKELFGEVTLLKLSLAKLAMVKEILEREGYDYEPHYDTFHDREMAKKNLPWYGEGYGKEGSIYKGL